MLEAAVEQRHARRVRDLEEEVVRLSRAAMTATATNSDPTTVSAEQSDLVPVLRNAQRRIQSLTAELAKLRSR